MSGRNTLLAANTQGSTFVNDNKYMASISTTYLTMPSWRVMPHNSNLDLPYNRARPDRDSSSAERAQHKNSLASQVPEMLTMLSTEEPPSHDGPSRCQLGSIRAIGHSRPGAESSAHLMPCLFALVRDVAAEAYPGYEFGRHFYIQNRPACDWSLDYFCLVCL